MIGTEFTSCWLKIGRAVEHFNTLKAEIIAWHDSCPYVISKQSDAEGRRYRVLVEINKPPFLDRWSLIAGDCIHNLRAALDNLVYALAVKESGSSPPPNESRLQFPITSTLARFAEQENRIAALSAASRARIERAQPYNRLHRDLPPLLLLLSEFDNIDKHRLLNVVITNVAKGKFSFTSQGKVDVPVSFELRDGPIESGAEVACFTMDPPKRDVEYRYDATCVVSIAHTAGPNGRTHGEIGYVLDLLIGEVKSIVNAAIVKPF